MENEKRLYPRTQVKWSVSGITNSGKMQGETKNISLNGAFICCENLLRPNEILLLTVDGPSGPLQVLARVVWSDPGARSSEASTSGIGVKFMWSVLRTQSEYFIWNEAG
jgi:hypothetical protein